MTSIKPTQITFLKDGQVTGKYVLTDSHFESLDDESYFTHGNPTQAKIIGLVNAQCTFFDDQLYRLDQNALTISLKRDATDTDPLIVDLAYDRLGPGDHDNGVYQGDEDSFGWILMKHAKASWAENVLKGAGTFADILNYASSVAGAAGASIPWTQYIVLAGKVIYYLPQKVNTPGHSDNSRVDNVSSVLFGAHDG